MMTRQQILNQKPLDPELLRPAFWRQLEENAFEEAFNQLDELLMGKAQYLKRLEDRDLFNLPNEQALQAIRKMEALRYEVQTLYKVRQFTLELHTAKTENSKLKTELNETRFNLQCTSDALIQTQQSLEFTTELCQRFMDDLQTVNPKPKT